MNEIVVVMDILMGYFGFVLFYFYMFVKLFWEKLILIICFVGNLFSDYVGKMG